MSDNVIIVKKVHGYPNVRMAEILAPYHPISVEKLFPEANPDDELFDIFIVGFDGERYSRASSVCPELEKNAHIEYAHAPQSRFLQNFADTLMDKPELVEERQSFRDELTNLINYHSRENNSNTPDFILADYLVDCLNAFDRATVLRAGWFRNKREDDNRTVEQPPQLF